MLLSLLVLLIENSKILETCEIKSTYMICVCAVCVRIKGMGTAENDTAKYGTRTGMVRGSRIGVALVFNVGNTNMEVW